MGRPGADGRHPLRSLMVALDAPLDTVEVRAASRRRVACPGAEDRSNLAWRALDALERATGRALPAEVRITKRIPARAGLGGGSSDAAAVLVAADRLFGLGLGAARLEAVAAEVGSDVPFFVRGRPRWVGGRGERLSPAPAPPPFAALLAMPRGLGLSTGAVYAAFDRMGPPPPDDGCGPPGGFAGLAAWVRNDLWPAALALEPRLGAPARALRSAGARPVLLCGSGACLAGLFPDRASARAAAARLPAGGFVAVGAPRDPLAAGAAGGDGGGATLAR